MVCLLGRLLKSTKMGFKSVFIFVKDCSPMLLAVKFWGIFFFFTCKIIEKKKKLFFSSKTFDFQENSIGWNHIFLKKKITTFWEIFGKRPSIFVEVDQSTKNLRNLLCFYWSNCEGLSPNGHFEGLILPHDVAIWKKKKRAYFIY